ncbi:MAG: hypothetical protein QXS37_01495 [Candidatus Aenigmatarchaeota archaeon]
MEIEIKDFEIKDEWDIQKACLILQLDRIGGIILSPEKREEYERKIIKFLWENIKKQFPKIEKFLKGKKGGFNKKSRRWYNTPIISVGGDFYMKLIGGDNDNWSLESVKLEPYEFFFNSDGRYFREQVVNAINKLIIGGYNKVEDFKKLVDALNETAVKDWIRIIIKEKDVGKVFIVGGEVGGELKW